MVPNHKRFALLWMALTIAGLAGVAIFNVLVDPGGSYPGLHLRSLDSLRYREHDRISKAEMAQRGDWDLIVLGSSRPKAGLPANHPVFQTNRACNLSLDAITFAELQAVFDFTRQRNPVKKVLLCLDFYMFCLPPRWILDFSQSRFNPDHDRLMLQCRRLLTQPALDESWRTVKQSLRGLKPLPQGRFGFLDTRLGRGECQRLVFDRTMRSMGQGYVNQRLDPANLELFRNIVRTCRQQGLQLEVVIVPVHSLDLELLYAGGRWQDFEQWKVALAEILFEEASPASLWDFTAYRGPATEPIPPLGDTQSRMTFYLENSHFTPALGSIVLDTVFGTNQTPDFGRKIDRNNVRQHLADILQDREIYVRQFPADIAWAHKIIGEVSPPGRTNQLDVAK